MPLVPQRIPAGFSSGRVGQLWGNLPHPIPFACNYYENDFNTYAAADWTVSPATGTSALIASNGGLLSLASGGTSGNGQGNALNPVSFGLTAGYQMWWGINLTFASSAIPNFVVGLTAGGAGAPTSGLYFSKPTASQVVSFQIRKAGTSTVMTNTTTIVDATSLALGFYYDGKPTPTLYAFSSSAFPTSTYFSAFGIPQIFGGYMFGAMGGDQTVALPLQALTNLPLVNMQPSFFVQTNATAVATMNVDYIMAATEIPRF